MEVNSVAAADSRLNSFVGITLTNSHLVNSFSCDFNVENEIQRLHIASNHDKETRVSCHKQASK